MKQEGFGSRSATDIAEQPDVLRRVLGANERELMRARDLVIGKRVVRLMGIGSSKHAAGYGARCLDLIGATPAIVLPAPGKAVALPPLDTDQPLIVLSQSGRTPAILSAVARALESSVDVIAITNEPHSQLSELATVTLSCEAGIERVVPATKSVTAQMLLLNALAGPLVTDEVDGLARAVEKAIAIEKCPAVTGEVPSVVVCAGFAGEWVADEIALKFAEMAGIPVTSESIVEYFHGPRVIDRATLAFLDPADPNSAELARLDRVVTVGPSEEHSLRTPTTRAGSLDAIINVVIGQCIAHAWALQLDADPDADRGLSKVTSTR